MAEDYESDPVAHYTLPEQNAIELACVDRDLAEWLTEFDGKPGRRAMVSTIKAARRYLERAHHAIHAAMLIEKGGDFSQCQEDACGHLEEGKEERPITVITEADLCAAIERGSIEEAEERLEGRAFVPMFGRLE